MESELPLKTLVVFIAVGIMVFIIVFIFAKRQITRYALKSRGPHVPVGSDAPKSLRVEIERRLRRVADIQCEPRLLSETGEHANSTPEACRFLYRMKAVDAVALLDTELQSCTPPVRRTAAIGLRMFLLEQRQPTGPLEGLEITTVTKFTDLYDHARHNAGEFQQGEYQDYMDFLNKIINHMRNKKNIEKVDVVDKSGPTIIDSRVPGAGPMEGSIIDSAVEALNVEILPPLASPDSLIDDARPAIELNEAMNDDDDNSSDDSMEEVQVIYRPLTDDTQLSAGSGLDLRGDSPTLPRDQESTRIGDQVSLCSRSSRSSSHLETQV